MLTRPKVRFSRTLPIKTSSDTTDLGYVSFSLRDNTHIARERLCPRIEIMVNKHVRARLRDITLNALHRAQRLLAIDVPTGGTSLFAIPFFVIPITDKHQQTCLWEMENEALVTGGVS